jgi:hypothetical protein
VAVYNQQIKANNGLIRVLLPHSNYTAQVFEKKSGQFIDTTFDIIEQKHFDKNMDPFGKIDYMLFIKAEVQADEIFYIKVRYTNTPFKLQQSMVQQDSKAPSLEVTGFNEGGEVLFKLLNPAQDIDQTFGISLKWYQGHSTKERELNKIWFKNITEEELADQVPSEGPYIFRPEWRNPLPHPYSKLLEDVIYQKGNLVETWTILYNDPVSHAQAVIKIMNSAALGDFIEFTVELNSVPIDDQKQKDITVNWKMYNGFKANKTFYTDSNALEMQQRKIFSLPRPEQTIPGNYYPVTSAIAMRDVNSNIQVTILNDRPQGGSADLFLNNTIELMQQRRGLEDDGKGLGEPLNETDSYDDLGIQVNANYYMQIFDRVKGKSEQRSQ